LEAVIDKPEAVKWAEGKGVKFFSVSAKTGAGINEMFKEIAEEIAEKRPYLMHQFDKPAFPEKQESQARQACC
jgi:GTPase SAR1 family protein